MGIFLLIVLDSFSRLYLLDSFLNLHLEIAGRLILPGYIDNQIVNQLPSFRQGEAKRLVFGNISCLVLLVKTKWFQTNQLKKCRD